MSGVPGDLDMEDKRKMTAEHLAEMDALRRRVEELEVVERQHAEASEALRESEAKYRDLVENSNDVVYTIDEKGVLDYVSPAVESFVGYAPSEVVGRPFSDFVSKQDLSRLREGFGRLLAGEVHPHLVDLVVCHRGLRYEGTRRY